VPRLTILGALHPDAMALLDARPDIEVTLVEDPHASQSEIAAAITGADAIEVRTATINAPLLDLAPDLKIISRHGVGCDSIDVAAMSARGLPVAIAVGGNDGTVAEHTLGMILGLAKDFERQTARVREADWSVRASPRGFDIEGRTLLVVGHGRIGSRVARLARAFGMRVIARDPYVDGFPAGIEVAETLEAGLAEADIVTVHTPKNPETIDLIGAPEIACMRPGAILINCARGGIVNEAAAAAALRSGQLGGYGCDVFSDEPVTADNPILGAPNTILTAHCAASTPEGMRRMGMIAIQNVLDCLDGCLRPDMIFNREELGL